MPDAQNKPIQIVPDPPGPGPAPAVAAPSRSRGRRAATLLGFALIGSLIGNGFQYVEGDALEKTLTQVTQDLADVTAERDALAEALAETQRELLESRGALAMVHSGIGDVRDQLRGLQELTASLAGIEPTAEPVEEPVAAEPTAAAPSDPLAAVERVVPSPTAAPEAPTSTEAEPAAALPADAVPESGETIAIRPTDSVGATATEAEGVASEAGTESIESTESTESIESTDSAAMADETPDATVAAAVSTPVDTTSEELAAGERYVTEPLEVVPAPVAAPAPASRGGLFGRGVERVRSLF